VVRRRERQAHDGREHVDGEDDDIGVGESGVPAGEVLGEIPLAEEEDHGRDEVGVDVDGFIVEV